jgi:hypothetical protein
MGKDEREKAMNSKGISLKLGGVKDKDSLSLKLGEAERGSISLKLKGTVINNGNVSKRVENKPRNQITIEMSSKALIEEKEAIKNHKSIWPYGIEITSSGRFRNIEADENEIIEIEEWAESKGMNCS